MSALAFALGCGLSVAGLLAAEAREQALFKAVAKSAASACFVLFALALGAVDDAYGRIILAGLLFCALGDVLLLSERKSLFLAGMGAFALGHAAYMAGFLSLGSIGEPEVGAAIIAMGYFSWRILRWLGPHLAEMRLPVIAYTGVISLMVVASVAGAGAVGDWRMCVGALAFAVSDVAVARDRFVKPVFFNRAWGLPLYYGAQLLIASTV